jgi:DNA-binding NarL/FixJ family response regulator
MLALAAGDATGAIGHLQSIRRLARGRNPGIVWCQADLIEAHHRAGQLAEAHELLDELAEDAARSRGRWAPAAVARSRALLERSDPVEAYSEAVEAFRAAGIPFEMARTLMLRGGHHRRHGRRADAARDLAHARTVFDRLGARRWSARVSTLVGEAPGPSRTLPAVLTPAELRVALAVGEGLTNKEAAQRLNISVKTVDHHLQRIYPKLGVRDRRQLMRLIEHDRGPIEV